MNTSHKIKFKKGRDANRMLVKKLIYNFLQTGHVETTLPKAKMLRSKIDSLIYRVKNDANTERVIYRYLDTELMKTLKTLSQNLENRVGGYVKLVKVGYRVGDGAEMGRVMWTVAPTSKINEDSKKTSVKETTPKVEPVETKNESEKEEADQEIVIEENKTKPKKAKTSKKI